MRINKKKRLLLNNKGFSLLEVLLGITVFMIGMLGVTALNISSLKSNTYSGNLSEATLIASSKIEELMLMDFDDLDIDDDGDGYGGDAVSLGRDFDNDGLDDDDPDDTDAPATNKDGVLNFGLDDIGADADGEELGVGRNSMYDVYWNVADNEPLTIQTATPRIKRINVIVRWEIKGVPRQISISTIRMKE